MPEITIMTSNEAAISFYKNLENLSIKIESGDIQEVDLLLSVIKARNLYIEAIQSALWGNRHGHQFDLKTELGRINDMITGEAF